MKKAGILCILPAVLLSGCAAAMKKPADSVSGRQEMPEQIMNEVIFG